MALSAYIQEKLIDHKNSVRARKINEIKYKVLESPSYNDKLTYLDM